jgi:hypothetical protein
MTMENAIEKYVAIPNNIRTMAAQANFDLHFGPHNEDDCMGFETTIEEIKVWTDELSTLWIEEASEFIWDSEPDYLMECDDPFEDCDNGCEFCDGGWIEAFPDGGLYEYDTHSITKMLFGTKLSAYL